MTNDGAEAGCNPWESITLLIAEVLENLNNKRYEKIYREDLLPISKNDVFLVLRDLFTTVINRSPVGRRAAVMCWVPSQGTLRPSVLFPLLPAPNCQIHRCSSHHSTAVSLCLLALFSATFVQGKLNNNGSFFTRLSFLLLGENTWEQRK